MATWRSSIWLIEWKLYKIYFEMLHWVYKTLTIPISYEQSWSKTQKMSYPPHIYYYWCDVICCQNARVINFGSPPILRVLYKIGASVFSWGVFSWSKMPHIHWGFLWSFPPQLLKTPAPDRQPFIMSAIARFNKTCYQYHCSECIWVANIHPFPN